MVIIPEIPCFAGDLKASAGTLAIIDAQYRSLCRGKESIFGMIQEAGFNPRDYITLFNLRQYDRSKSSLFGLRKASTKAEICDLEYFSQVQPGNSAADGSAERCHLGRSTSCYG